MIFIRELNCNRYLNIHWKLKTLDSSNFFKAETVIIWEEENNIFGLKLPLFFCEKINLFNTLALDVFIETLMPPLNKDTFKKY